MARVRQPEMTGCKPLPLKYKETPVVNAAGTPLGMCEKCQGSGEICTAERKTFDKRTGAAVFECLPEFPGSLRRQRERGGYTVVGTCCTGCKGAGLYTKGSVKS